MTTTAGSIGSRVLIPARSRSRKAGCGRRPREHQQLPSSMHVGRSRAPKARGTGLTDRPPAPLSVKPPRPDSAGLPLPSPTPPAELSGVLTMPVLVFADGLLIAASEHMQVERADQLAAVDLAGLASL